MQVITPDMLVKLEKIGPLCACGCGGAAPVAKRTNIRKGERRGEPLQYISGHNSRGRTDLTRYHVIDRGLPTPCWEWIGPLNRKGYGFVQIDRVKKNAHRAVYEHLVGPLPRNLHLDHLCRNKRCVNPAHMEPVSAAENNRRKSMSALALVNRMIDLHDPA